MDLLFGKPKAVKLGSPGQEAAGRQETGDGIPEEKRADIPDVQIDFTDPSGPEVRPTYQSWDKIE